MQRPSSYSDGLGLSQASVLYERFARAAQRGGGAQCAGADASDRLQGFLSLLCLQAASMQRDTISLRSKAACRCVSLHNSPSA